MINLPFPITGDNWEDMKPAIMELFRDLYENRIGGAMVWDVFEVSGDTLQIKLAPGSGLYKAGGMLSIDVDTIGTNGAVMKVAYTAKGVILVGTAASTVAAVAVGTDGDCLVADSSETPGVRWKHPTAANIINVPAGNIAATNVQTALNELDTEKAPKASPVHTGVTTDASLKVSDLTSGKYPIASTDGLLVDGPTPLAGTKIYYVADSSGGAVNRKLTFVDGILTSET